MNKNVAIDAAYEALEGRLGSGHDDVGKAELVLWVCEAYVRTEDALPGDEFDGDGYELPKAVEALVKQRDGEHEEREAAETALEDEEAARQLTLGLLKRVQTQRDRLAEALLDTREGQDKDDGKPCWCSSPTYARAHGGHGPRCVMARSALSPDLGSPDPEKPTVQP